MSSAMQKRAPKKDVSRRSVFSVFVENYVIVLSAVVILMQIL